MTYKSKFPEIGFKQAAVSGWELGTREPSYDVLLQLCYVLNTSADYLLGKIDIE